MRRDPHTLVHIDANICGLAERERSILDTERRRKRKREEGEERNKLRDMIKRVEKEDH